MDESSQVTRFIYITIEDSRVHNTCFRYEELIGISKQVAETTSVMYVLWKRRASIEY